MKNKKVIFFTAIALVSFLYFFMAKNNINIIYEDLNSNGVWDDLEPYIQKTAKDKYQKMALEYEFKTYQNALLDPSIGIKEKRNEITSETDKSSACIDKVWGGYKNAPDYRVIRDTVLSSRARIRAWIKYNSNRSGGIYSLWDEDKMGNPCPFNLDK